VDPIALLFVFGVGFAVGYGVREWKSRKRRRRYTYLRETADEARRALRLSLFHLCHTLVNSSSGSQEKNRANLVNPRIRRIMNVRGMGRREGRPHG
jgi:hypothetical protein